MNPYPPISIIVAMAKNGVIGRDNRLPWHLPADLKYFKSVTMGKPIIMGRKTYESIGKPLPGRKNIILTHNHDFVAAGCEIATSVEAALAAAGPEEEVMIIGGANIYRLFLPLTSKIYLTLITEEISGDAHFPSINPAEWHEISHLDCESDTLNPHRYSFIVLTRDA